MSTQIVKVYSEFGFQTLVGRMRKAFMGGNYLWASFKTSKPRSLDQNGLSHVWYEQISRELGEETPEGVKCECKLRFGVPILRAEDEVFREMYDSAIKNTLTYEQKLKVMRFLPVTSLMDTDQLSRYLKDMQRGYAGRVELLFPDEMEKAA